MFIRQHSAIYQRESHGEISRSVFGAGLMSNTVHGTTLCILRIKTIIEICCFYAYAQDEDPIENNSIWLLD